jgi:hypothetical protein
MWSYQLKLANSKFIFEIFAIFSFDKFKRAVYNFLYFYPPHLVSLQWMRTGICRELWLDLVLCSLKEGVFNDYQNNGDQTKHFWLSLA